MKESSLSTEQKALRLNLDPAKYGTVAEIGAGQEVARWFFRVGRAAGTIAKTISAYDMAVSDAIYGRSDRYVSRMRLESMLGYEFGLLLQRLSASRGDKSTFFAFADTVATRAPRREDGGHGWMGVRFQAQPGSEPSQVMIHVTTHDRERVHQQEALGVLGVNLLYAAFFLHADPVTLIGSLLDELSAERTGVDLIKFSGPAFAGVDHRLMSLQLVEQGLCDTAMFTAQGEVVQPAEVLYKKPVLVERGRFRPVTKLTIDMLRRAQEQFLAEPGLADQQPVVLLEMTLSTLAAAGGVSHEDFLARVDTLSVLGNTVVISKYGRYFRLVEYLQRYTDNAIRIAVGVPSLRDIGNDRYYEDLEGGILESAGRMFKRNVKLYVYPYKDPASGQLITAETVQLPSHVRHLHAYLVENGFLESIRSYDPAVLDIASDLVFDKLRSGDPTWEAQVPGPVVELIKRERLFGWRPPAASK
jgi:hypothetical protein